MKIFKAMIVFVLIMLLMMGLALYIFLRNFDANRYRDWAAQQIGKSLQTTAEIDRMHLKFGFISGIRLDVDGVRLADQGLLNGVGVNLNNVQLVVDALHFFKTREILLSRVVIKEAFVRLDIAKIQQQATDETIQPVPEGSRDDSNSGLPRVFLESIRIENGKAVLLADGKTIMKEIEINDINLSVNGLSLGESSDIGKTGSRRDHFTFELICAAFGSPRALFARGKGWMNLEVRQVRLDDVVIETSLSDFSINQITETFPSLNDVDIKSVQGKFRGMITQIVLGPDGVPVLVAKGSLTQAGISSGFSPAVVSNGDIHFEYSDYAVDILDSTFNITSGRVAFKGRVDDVLEAPAYQFDIKIDQVALQDIMPKIHPEISFSGNLNGTVFLTGKGFQAPDMVQNAKAQMNFTVADGKLDNFNVLNYIFDRITIIPDLAQRFEQALPEEYKREARLNQTLFDAIDLTMNLDQGVLAYAGEFVADIIELKTTGSIDWRHQLLFKGTCFLPQKLSSALVKEMSIFSPLVDVNNQKVVIPLADYRGRVKDFRLLPDMSHLTKTMIVPKVEEKVRDFLGEALGIKRGDSVDAPADQAGEPAQEDPKESLKRNLFDGLLNAVFE